MRKFESHLTAHINNATSVEFVAKHLGMKFSKIDGDALMGDKPFCYITAYDTDAKKLLEKITEAQHQLEGFYGIQTLRVKIEEIIYDTKTGVDNINVK